MKSDHSNCTTGTTHNSLVIPTVLKRGALSIAVRGNVRVELTYVGEQKDWQSSMTATWAANIVFASDASGGLSVTTSPSKIVPEFVGPEPSTTFGISTSNSVYSQLKAQLPSVFDFGHIVEGLKSSLTGISSHLHSKYSQYAVTNPSFNQHGDLLLELRFRQETQPQHSRTYTEKTSSSSIRRTESWFRTVKREVGEVLAQTGLSVGSPTETSSSSASKSSSVEEKKLLSGNDNGKVQSGKGVNGKSAAGAVPSVQA